VAYTDETNLASNRVLEKCGFYRAGMEHIYGGDCLRWEWKA
jgi:RimJ/RimL family protein N-acetyltransferase